MSATMLPGEQQEVKQQWTDFLRQYVDQGRENDMARLVEEYPKDSTSLYVDYHDLTIASLELADGVLENPNEYLDLASEAVRDYENPADITLKDVDVRLENIGSVPEGHRCKVGQLRQDRKNTLTAIEGQVAKRAVSQGQWEEIVFECQRCGTNTTIPQRRSTYQEPHECAGCERQGPFTKNEAESVGRDYQLVRLQEPPESAVGANAASIDLVFAEDLVDEVRPGDRVTVLAELWTETDDSQDSSGTFELVGEAINVRHHETDYKDIEITAEDEERIKQIANDRPFQALRDSIKPSHHGHDNIKKAIALQLFGGTWKTAPDGDRTRGSIHIILIGDPGADKTGLLEYAEELAPRGIFTSGKNTTGAGLTCAAVQDDFGDGGWTLEGGALVQADGGLAAIDEFDKIDEDEIEAMHEALSRGRVSPSKAGMKNIRLPAETTVLAAGNPKNGRFDNYEPIGEQIDIEPAMFSRFDLIFTVKDRVDEDSDAELADHILSSHRASQQRERGDSVTEHTQTPDISQELLRKYVAYAREELDPPVLGDEAAERLKDFYTSVRAQGSGEDSPVPVTARKLDALVRLAEASARVRLSETISGPDADRAIGLVRDTLNDVGIDTETGEYDADLVETGRSKAQRDRIKTLKQIIAALEDDYEQGAPLEEIMDICAEKGMAQSKVEHELEKLKDQGQVYEPRNEHYRAT